MIQVSFITPPLSALLFQTQKERRCFDFFQRRTIPQLAGSFKSQFWDRLLLQAIHHEPAVQHASVALGALHEHFELCSNLAEDGHGFAVQHYLKAIRLVTIPTREGGRQAADVALMSCVLFVCFEVSDYTLSLTKGSCPTGSTRISWRRVITHRRWGKDRLRTPVNPKFSASVLNSLRSALTSAANILGSRYAS